MTPCLPLQGAATVTAERLSHFIPDAIELARQGEAVHHGLPRQQLQTLRTAFSLSRRLNVTFAGDAQRAGTAAQVGLLESLARALDAAGPAGEAVRDCKVVLGEGGGVDAQGRAWLWWSDTVAEWAHALQRLDVALVHERTAAHARVHAAEAAVAKALGMRAVFTGAQLALSGLYDDFLRVRLALPCAAARSRRTCCTHVEEYLRRSAQ